MRKALATLPWVEQDSVQPNVKTREVRFKLKDKSSWNEAKVRDALKEQNFAEMSVKAVPK